ncbi:MAG: hypothetical protein ABIR56_19430 [Polaromonas sp.]
MNLFKKLSHRRCAASGLEWTLWRKLPLIAVVGTLLPLASLALVYLLADSQPGPAEARWLQMLNYVVVGVIVFHWSMVATVAIGCLIVMVMKGPGYVADGYKVSHGDQPRAVMETAEEATAYRLPAAAESTAAAPHP